MNLTEFILTNIFFLTTIMLSSWVILLFVILEDSDHHNKSRLPTNMLKVVAISLTYFIIFSSHEIKDLPVNLDKVLITQNKIILSIKSPQNNGKFILETTPSTFKQDMIKYQLIKEFQ